MHSLTCNNSHTTNHSAAPQRAGAAGSCKASRVKDFHFNEAERMHHAPSNVGAIQRFNAAAKPGPRLKMRPQRLDPALPIHVRNFHVRRIIRVPMRAPRTMCGGVPSRTVGTAKCGASACCTLPERKTVKSHQSKARAIHSSSQQAWASQKILRELDGESASLSPIPSSALKDRKHTKRTANAYL